MKFPPCLRCALLVALAAGLRAQEKPAEEPAKSANWLVDAMADKAADSRDDAKPGASQADGRSATAVSHVFPKPDDGAANPLSSYLATWMTPRDLEILKIKSTDANIPGGTTVSGKDRSAARGPATNLNKNPYLIDIAPEVATNAKEPPPAPAPKSLVLVPPAEKKDAAPAKTPGPPPDLIKSQEDQKYFPQLKRF